MDIINNLFSSNKDNDIKNPNNTILETHDDEYYKKYIKYKLKYLDLLEQIGGKGKSGKGRKGKSRKNSKKRSHKKKSHKKKSNKKKSHKKKKQHKKKKHHDEESDNGDSDDGSDNTDQSEEHDDDSEEANTPHHQMHRQHPQYQQHLQHPIHHQPIHHLQYSSATPDEYSGSSHYMSPQHVMYQHPQDSMNEITPDDDSRQQLKSKLTEHAHKIKGHIQNIHGYFKQKLQQPSNDELEPEHIDQDHLDNIDEYENFGN